jgi:hypothetical protein
MNPCPALILLCALFLHWHVSSATAAVMPPPVPIRTLTRRNVNLLISPPALPSVGEGSNGAETGDSSHAEGPEPKGFKLIIDMPWSSISHRYKCTIKS